MERIKISPQGCLQFPEFEASGMVGREKDLETLDTIIKGKRDHMNQVTVIRGMVGEGKTYLAMAYCQKAYKEKTFEAVFWLDANDSMKRRQYWIDICDILDIPKQQPASNQEDLGLEERDRIHQGISALRRLEKPWLLVLDGLNSPNWTSSVMDFVASSREPHGAVLITTRWMDDTFLRKPPVLPLAADFMDLKPMAKDFLHKLFSSSVSGHGEWDREKDGRAATRIFDQFGHHVWVITQICQFIKVCKIKDLNMFECRRIDSAWSELSFLRGYQGDNTDCPGPLSLCNTLDESLDEMFGRKWSDEAEEMANGAFLLLSFLSLFDCSAVSMQLIIAAVDSKRDTSYEFPWASICIDRGDLSEARLRLLFKTFYDCSLLQATERPKEVPQGLELFSIHPIIREWLYIRLEKNERLMLINLAMETFDSMYSRSIKEESKLDALIFLNRTFEGHTVALLKSLSSTSLHDIGTCLSSHSFFQLLHIESEPFTLGMYPRMVEKFYRVENELPCETPITRKGYFDPKKVRLTALWVLASCCTEATRYEVAKRIWDWAKDEAIKICGPLSREATGCWVSRSMVLYEEGRFGDCTSELKSALDQLTSPLEADGNLDLYVEIANMLADLFNGQIDQVTTHEEIASHLGSAFAFARGLLCLHLSGGPHPDTVEVLKWARRLQELYGKAEYEGNICTTIHKEPCSLRYLHGMLCSINKAETFRWIHDEVEEAKEVGDLFWKDDLIDKFQIWLGKHQLEPKWNFRLADLLSDEHRAQQPRQVALEGENQMSEL